jgi:hypothetical protein
MADCWPSPPVRHFYVDNSMALLADVIEAPDSPLVVCVDMPPSSSPSAGRLSRITAAIRSRAVGSSTSRALVAACASNVLGLLALLVSLQFPGVAAAIAGLGVMAGCLGLGAKRSETAILGLAFSCAALLVSGFFLAVAAYVHVNGMNPWDPFVAQPFGP